MLLTEKPEGLALKALLRDPDQPVTFFNIQRYLKPHFPMSMKDKKALEDAPALDSVTDTKPKSARKKPPPVDVVPDAAVVTDDPKEEPPKAPPKKRVVRNPKSA